MAQHDGNGYSSLWLKFDATNDRWQFLIGANNTPGWWVDSTGPVTKDDWVNLIGVFDASTGLLRFYVDGVLQGSVGTAGWHATGAFNVGRLQWYGGYMIEHWQGDIDQVRVFAGAMSERQVQNLYRS
jgi:hypothetical protein